ncbi:MAG TPA: RNA polymerase sigma factor [Pyrinomonadaceae bacterium]|jgi:RNA polymerase sigma factor (sigma-70 family)|nr:RNA polymerase sigma factor [Pyrinomonadaceae bacterium]
MLHEKSDGELANSARDGDQNALTILYARFAAEHLRLIAAYLFRKGCRRAAEHAQDVRSEAWVSIVDKISNLRDPAVVRSWFLRILIQKSNHHLTWCITQSRTATAIETADSQYLSAPSIAPPQRLVEASIDAERILTLAEEISAPFADIVYLYLLKELDFQTIAVMLGMQLAAVRTTYYRHREILRERLGVPSKPKRPSRRLRLPIEGPDDDGGPPDSVIL